MAHETFSALKYLMSVLSLTSKEWGELSDKDKTDLKRMAYEENGLEVPPGL